MVISYALLAQFLLYFVVIKLFSSRTIHPVAAGLIVSIGGFAIEFTISAILYSQYGNTPLDLLLIPSNLVKLALQVVVGVSVFALLKKYEDSLAAYFAITILGGVTLFSVAPFLATQIV